MHPSLILSLALQIGCAVHAVRTRRPIYWLFVLLAGSYIGIAVYVSPKCCRTCATAVQRGRRCAARTTASTRSAASARPRASSMSPTRSTIAAVWPGRAFDSGDYQQAAELYRSGLRGLYATDPDLMLGLARSQFALNLHAEARQTLDALIAANPAFRSSEGHLLYARCL